MYRFPAEQGMVGTKRMGKASLADRHTCYENSTRIATHIVPTSLFPTPIMDTSHVSAQNASCSIPGRAHSHCTYPFPLNEKVPCGQDVATNTACHTQDNNSVLIINPHSNSLYIHHHNPLLEHRSNPQHRHHPIPLPNLSQATPQHNTPATRRTPSEGTFQFSGSNVLAHGKTKATIPQETLSGIFKGIFLSTITDILIDTITHIFPNKTTDMRHDMERPSQPRTGCQNTKSVFATQGLHVLANQTDDHGTSERNSTTAAANTAPDNITERFRNRIHDQGVSYKRLSSCHSYNHNL